MRTVQPGPNGDAPRSRYNDRRTYRRRLRRLVLAAALNLLIVAGEVTAGLAAHSLALVSDAGHNLADVAAIMVTVLATRLAMVPATDRRTFGWHRSTILAALANAALLATVAVLVGAEAVSRLRHPPQPHAPVVVAVAVGACVANVLGVLAVLERSPSPRRAELSMRAVLWHLASDAGSALAVAVAAGVIWAVHGAYWLDPALALGIALVVALAAWHLLSRSTEVLLESTPRDLDLGELGAAITAVDGIAEVHDLHVWSLSSDVRALSAHVVLSGHPSLEEAQAVGTAAKQAIAGPFAISHATFELECEACDDAGERCL